MTTTDSSTGLAFRPDIEGLRALAILAVVGAHTGMPLMAGGFIGVDVFFVLSGYLISGLLIREYEANARIAYLNFYARRFRRLLPGLVLMLLVTAGAAAVLLAPFEQPFQSDAIRMAFLWLSNFHFAAADFGYFDAAAASNLVLHTWSLGVEEQFYLAWPLLVVYFMAPYRDDAAPRRSNLITGFMLVFGLSFLGCVVLTVLSPLWGFYSMPTRAWQFALGALVFLHSHGTEATRPYAHLAAPAAWAGLLLILASTVLLRADMTYPGAWALLPAAGAALLLFAGAGSAVTRVGAMLASRPMQAIGRLSYSWYLWHWPVLVLGQVLVPDAGLGARALLALLSLLIAALAYALLERPVRNSVSLRARPVLTAACALVLMLGGAVLSVGWKGHAQTWAVAPDQLAYVQIRSDLPALYANGCDTWFNDARVLACSFGDKAAPNTAVMFGDSIGAQWFSALVPAFTQSGWRLLVVTKSACPMVDEPIFYSRIGSRYLVCEAWRQAAVGFLAELKPQLIFMGGTASYAYSPEQWRDGTARLLEPLAAAAGKIYLIRGTPILPFDGPGCLARQDWQPSAISRLTDCRAPQGSEYDFVLDALRSAASGFSNVSVLDFNPIICPDGMCRARDGERVVFRDEQHISNRYVQVIGPDVMQVIAESQ